jgi:tape measure domain-containing protein
VAGVDDRVVSMSFENGRFESGVSSTLSSLDKLKAALKFDGASKGLDTLEAKSGRINFGPMSSAVDSVSGKFTALATAAGVVLGGIATKAISAGASVVKSFTLGPITAGLSEYETNLNSVQTILANTAASGAKLKDVNKALAELNTYADKTIYNFSEMTKNIGTFTAAGVDLKTATASIKGIANLAALSGSNSQQASTAMYQLSQAISSGRVSLQDWNSVVNAGMGGTVFQRALAQTAERMGTLDDGAVKLTGKMKNVTIAGDSFRESIQAKPGEKSWLTSEVLTETLKQFTGDMTDAELKAKGFTDAQIKAIQVQAKTALNAATQVKTLSGVLDTAKEAAGSGWAQTWQIIFGDFGEAKTLFTATSNAVNGFITASANARNSVLKDWKELGGRTALIDSIKNVFEALKSVVEPIKDAFREIFPPTTGKQLYDLTVRLKNFTETLKIGPETSENLKRSFAGLFAALDIGKQILAGVVSVLGHLLGAVTSGSGGFLKFTGNLGDSLVALDKWLKQGDRLKNFFDGLGTVLSAPIKLLGRLKDVLIGLFDGVDSRDAQGILTIFDGMGEKLKPLSTVLDIGKKAWDGFVDAVLRVKEFLQPAIDSVVETFANFANQLGEAIASQNFDTVFKIIQTGLLGGILLAIKRALGGGLNIDIGGGALKALAGTFDALTGSLKTLEANVKANTLLQIAAAVGVLSVAVVALSKVDGADLEKSMTAIAVGFGQLVGAMTLLTKGVGTAGFAKLPFISGSLILLATAIDVLVLAVRGLSGLSWQELSKGLAGVGGLLVGLSVAIQPLSAGSAKLVLIGAGLVVIAGAVRLLAESVKTFGGMDWRVIGKGLVGVAGALVAVGLAVNLIPANVLLIGPGLVAVGVALGAIAGAVLAFGKMNWGTIGKGLVGVAGALVAIAVGLALMPPTMPIMALGLIAVGAGLTTVAAAIATMGSMSVGKLAKGIIAIGAALVVLAGGLTLMIAALPGAVALTVAAAGLLAIVPVIGMLGTMSWGTIGKGLAAIGAAFIVIGAAGAVAAPAMVLAGAGLIALGAGLAVVGGGLYLIAKAFSLMASDGTKGVAVVIAALTGLVAIVPKIVIDFAKGLVGIVESIVKIAPAIINALANILGMLLDVIIKDAPKIADAFTALMKAGLKVLVDNVPNFISSGATLLKSLLKGILDNIGDVTNTMVNIVIKFLQTLTGRLPDIVRAGGDALASLLKGIANNIRTVANAAGDIMSTLLSSIADQYGKVVSAGATSLAKFLSGVGSSVKTVVSAGADLVINIIEGVGDKAASIATAGRESIVKFINAVASEALKLGREGADAVINFINGVADAIRDKAPQLRAAGANLASAIITGVLGNLNGSSIVNKLVDIAGSALDAVKHKLGIKSPSVEFAKVGRFMMMGWTSGIDDNSKSVGDSVDDIVNTMLDSISRVPELLDGLIDLDPVIKPILDLSDVQNGARRLNTVLGDASSSAVYSLAQETAASQERAAESSQPSITEIKFEQHNTSPKALSEADIYRQTRNQLSQAKAVLT